MIESVRYVLESAAKSVGFTHAGLAAAAGLNRGIINNMFSSTSSKQKPISVKQLDAITDALGYEEGYFYNLFVREFKIHKDWRIAKSFILRAIELGKEEQIQGTLDLLMEDKVNISTILQNVFVLAEEINIDRPHSAVCLYKHVVDHETKMHCDRHVISQYRIFRAAIDQKGNVEEDYRAAILFEPYCKSLPVAYRLDAWLKLGIVYYKKGNWRDLERCADELHELTRVVLNQHRSKKSKKTFPDSERHFVVYYGQGYLMKGIALELQERYDEALEYIEGYSDLSWFPELDSTGLIEVEKFRNIAQGNLFTIRILSGDVTNLPDYVDFLENHPDELLPGMATIIRAANRYKFNIDHILDRFKELLLPEASELLQSYYTHDMSKALFLDFYYNLSFYYARNRSNKGIDIALRSLQLSIEIDDKAKSLDLIALIEQNKQVLTDNQGDLFHKLITGVGKNEKFSSVNVVGS